MIPRLQPGDRFAHIDSREGRVIERVGENRVRVEYDEGGIETLCEGYCEKRPAALAQGGRG